MLDVIVSRFFRDRLFTTGRAQLLAAQLPASDIEATQRRDTQAAALRARGSSRRARRLAASGPVAPPADLSTTHDPVPGFP